MGAVLLHILQWILGIILFLLSFLLVLLIMILIVPIRYQAEGEYMEKQPGLRGKITWFFYLIYMKFWYEEEFRVQVRVFGIKVYDNFSFKDTKRERFDDKKEKNKVSTEEESMFSEDEFRDTIETERTAEITEKSMLSEQKNFVNASEAESVSNAEIDEGKKETVAIFEEGKENLNYQEEVPTEKKPGFGERLEKIRKKIKGIFDTVKGFLEKIREGKLKVDYYLELWNRKETQITFQRAKKKLGKMIKAVLPGKWKVTGEIGFENPCTTGQMMGVLGSLYPVLGNHVSFIPDFEQAVLNIEGKVKGHIRLGNLLYQMVSLVLNRHCIKFIKMIFDEMEKERRKEEI